ncbi:MAG: DUF4397 domain-containing protein [Candidatus Bipolaricaulia bacterium]
MKTLVTKGARFLTVLLLLSLVTGASAYSQVPVTLPDVNLTPGETTTVPVEVGDVSEEDIASFNFTITYDPSLVDVTATPSGLSSDPDASVQINNPSDGELSVAVASDSPLEGSGSLVDLEITAAPDVAGTTALSFSSFQFQEGTPAAATTDGSVEVKDVFVSLPDITTRTGQEVEIDINVSDLTDLGARSFQFDLPFDPAVLSGIEVVQEGTLSQGMSLQSTISGGEVSVAAAQSDPLEGSGTLLTIRATLMTGSTPLEFSTFQFNEGRISAGTDPGSVQAADVVATFPEFPAAVGTSQTFAVRTTDLNGLDVFSYEFTFEFDPSVINVTGLSTEGTLSETVDNTDITVNGDSAVVAVASTSPIEGEGPLIKIQTEIIGAGESPLRARSFQFNEGSPSVVTVPGSITATAESSPTQFIHNAADPAASSVDVYFGDRKVLDDFEFRTATEFLPVPADATFDVGVAPGSSSGPDDIIARFPAEFASGTSHTVVANGVLNPDNFVDNPDGEPISFEFFIQSGATTTASAGNVNLRAVHGATDAPTVDIGQESGPTLLEDLTYGDVTADYLSATAEEKVLTVSPGGSNTPVAAFEADLSGLGGTAATVLASGFLNPSANQDGPGFALIAALPNGDVITFEPPTAQAQFIHNAADPAADSVDVYLNGELALDDFEFRTATPFVDVPAVVPVEVGVAGPNSAGVEDTLASQTVTFASGQAHTVVANGVLDPSSFADNPDGEPIGFEFFAASGADSTASSGQVALRAVHGVTDAPTIDIDENGTTLLDNLTYGAVTSEYLSVTAEEKRLVITPGDSDDAVAAFEADLSGLGGTAATVLASGFLDPSANQNGESFALVAVLPNGDVVVFEQNLPPNITDVPSGTVQPTRTFNDQVDASDPDGDPLSYSLQGDPGNASIDSTGAFSFTPPFSQRGSDASFTVQVSDGTASVDSSFTVSVNALDRQPISVDISESFVDATVATNYILIGLPGQVQLPLAQTLQGDEGARNQWRAFWDDGSSTTQDGLVEFDGSSQFDFRPGRGFWVLSRNPLEVSDTYEVVSLSESGNATIDLHSGWNIISNPLGNGPSNGDVSWAAVQAENDISQPLFSYEGGFSQTSTFASARDGDAYYFLNDQGLDQLRIPYFGTSAPSVASKKASEKSLLTLSASKEGQLLSSVQLGTSSSAKEGRDKLDHFGPPAYFDDVRLQVQNDQIASKYPLATDIRPTASTGQSFDVKLSAEPGVEMTLRVEGLAQFSASKEVLLYDPLNATTHDLRDDPSVEVTPNSEDSRFVLLIGKSSYVEEKKSDLVPQRVTLHQNYPNPFRSKTTLKYALPEESDVTIEVFDLLGRKVGTLTRGRQDAGTHTVRWDVGGQGVSVASGTYIVRLRADGVIRTMKVTRVR